MFTLGSSLALPNLRFGSIREFVDLHVALLVFYNVSMLRDKKFHLSEILQLQDIF